MGDETTRRGAGEYRELYARYGGDLWGDRPSSAVVQFLDDIAEDTPGTVLDIAAGTGKNAFAVAARGASRVVAVEIDPLAVHELLDRVVRLEDAGDLAEGTVAIVLDDALEFLEHNTERFDCVVCYGLLHVFRDEDRLARAIELIQRPVRPGGHLIVQSLTNRHQPPPPPPDDPLNEPYLERIAVDDRLVDRFTASGEWDCLHFDDTPLKRIHQRSAVDGHRYGSVRAILRRRG